LAFALAHIRLLSQIRSDKPAPMAWPALLNMEGYSIGLLGIVLLIWSLLKQGVSLLKVGLLAAGFLLLLIAGFLR
jgi:hypothetical protein